MGPNYWRKHFFLILHFFVRSKLCHEPWSMIMMNIISLSPPQGCRSWWEGHRGALSWSGLAACWRLTECWLRSLAGNIDTGRCHSRGPEGQVTGCLGNWAELTPHSCPPPHAIKRHFILLVLYRTEGYRAIWGSLILLTTTLTNR